MGNLTLKLIRLLNTRLFSIRNLFELQEPIIEQQKTLPMLGVTQYSA